MKDNSTFNGMDVHKNSIDIAVAEKGRKGHVWHYGKIEGNLAALDKVIQKLVINSGRLHLGYEAGPCGYQVYRLLNAQGFDCAVVAPSGIPKPSGKQIKAAVNRSDPSAVAPMADVPGRSSASEHARRLYDRGGHNGCRGGRPETV